MADSDLTSTPIASSSKETAPRSLNLSVAPIRTNERQERPKASVLNRICDAIEAIGAGRKGATYIAIKNYIYGSDGTKFKTFHFKKALLKGLETGVLKRPSDEETNTGILGHYLVNKTKQKPAKKVPKKKAIVSEDPDVQQQQKTVKDVKPNNPKEIKDAANQNVKLKKVAKKDKTTKKNAASKENKEKVHNSTTTEKGKVLTAKNVTTRAKPTKKKQNERLDVSDSEMVVKKKERKSVKDYASDSELNVTKKVKAVKVVKKTVKKNVKPEEENAKTTKASTTKKTKKN